MDYTLKPRKSKLDQAEINNKSTALDFKSRQVLILADGQRSLAQLQQMRAGFNVLSIVDRLVAEGYLQRENAELAAPVQMPKVAPAELQRAELPRLSAEQIAMAREFMAESTRNHMGILGSTLLDKLKEADDTHQIRSSMAQWHMALRDSRQGRAMADEQLQQLHRMLGLDQA